MSVTQGYNLLNYMDINTLDTFTKIYICFIASLFGLCMGSFLNCCAYRLCHNLSIVKGRSKCDNCDHVLGFKDLIPVISYLTSGGKCRYCGAKLNVRYLVSEIISGVAYALVVIKFGISLESVEYLILTSLMLLASFADLEDYIIPDSCIILGLINRLIFCFLSKDFLSELLSSLVGGLAIALPLILLVIVMEKILKKEAMGGGDIKLIFMVGTYLTIGQSILSILIACVVGLIYAYARQQEHEQFPFGPSLCLGYFISILIGTSLINMYLSLF